MRRLLTTEAKTVSVTTLDLRACRTNPESIEAYRGIDYAKGAPLPFARTETLNQGMKGH